MTEPTSKHLALARAILGLAQMLGAATALLLLVNGGMTRLVLIIAGATTCLTILSRVLFHGR